jgi:SNF family Na+-dependent transporter
MNRWTFLIATTSAAIGLGNVWRFPYLSFKHGGSTFIYTYLYALFIVGIPMLLLELTLGQKMQKGSAGALRGIVPRLAGIGYVASFSGFVTALTYNILLGISLIYLLSSGSEPWAAKNFDSKRSVGCLTAEMMQKPSEEIYLFTQVVKLYGEKNCDVYKNGDPGAFSMPLFWANLFCWLFCCLILAVGPRAIEIKALITFPLRFIFIIIFVV